MILVRLKMFCAVLPCGGSKSERRSGSGSGSGSGSSKGGGGGELVKVQGGFEIEAMSLVMRGYYYECYIISLQVRFYSTTGRASF